LYIFYLLNLFPISGKNPVWNEEFAFDISNEREMELEVLDKETVGNDKFMGTCKVSIMEWIASGRFEGEIDLVDKAGKPVGRVTLAVKFERPNMIGNDDDDANKSDAMNKTGGVGMAMTATGGMPGGEAPRDPAGKFTDDEILEAFKAFDLDRLVVFNGFV